MSETRIIAVEEHWGTPETEDLRDEWIAASGLPGTKNHVSRAENLKTLWDFDRRISVMDEAGISQQVLSLSSPGVQGIQDLDRAREVSRRLNDKQFELMNRFPGRFFGFTNLPLADPKWCADELERCMKEYGYVGALVHGHCYGKYLDDRSFDVLWEAAEANKAIISMHITDPQPGYTMNLGGSPLLSGPCWSWGIEAATHALRLMVGGVFDRFPNAAFSLGHMGEGLPYLLGRLEEGTNIVTGQNRPMKKRFTDYMRENIYISTSGGYYPETMACAIDALGIDRIFYAVDYPFAKADRAKKQFEACNLTQEQQEKILYKNFLNATGKT